MAKNRRPTAEMLRGIDALVFDIQDVGARFYTYISTMAYAHGRGGARRTFRITCWTGPTPSPACTWKAPVLDRDELNRSSAIFRLPLRHGMTMGELARMFNAENQIGARPARDADERTGSAATGSTQRACPGSILHPICAA